MDKVYIGTSGWHYSDWTKLFYPSDITGYHELTYHARYFNTVENNSSFYRVAGENTYKTWYRMTPDQYLFSLKLNKTVTHIERLQITGQTIDTVRYILNTTQVLQDKCGAILIQLPAGFRYDLKVLDTFLDFFVTQVRKQQYAFDVAIEFRNNHWFTDDTYTLLKKHNVALAAGDSSRWPGVRQITADTAYIRMHGPAKLFASSYSDDALNELGDYIVKVSPKLKRVYVYFNNDFHGYAIDNAKTLQKVLKKRGL